MPESNWLSRDYETRMVFRSTYPPLLIYHRDRITGAIMVINTDKITTVLGIVGGASAIAYQYNIAPQYTGSVAAVSGALLGFFTNKQPK